MDNNLIMPFHNYKRNVLLPFGDKAFLTEENRAWETVILRFIVMEKKCVSCGLSFSFRRKFKKNWEEVKYCSKKCRKNKLQNSDKELEDFILDFSRGPCPPRVTQARTISRTYFGIHWKKFHQRVLAAIRRLSHRNILIIHPYKKALKQDIVFEIHKKEV